MAVSVRSKGSDARRAGGGSVCITQIVPALGGLYERRSAEIETVLLAVEREARLIEDSLCGTTAALSRGAADPGGNPDLQWGNHSPVERTCSVIVSMPAILASA